MANHLQRRVAEAAAGQQLGAEPSGKKTGGQKGHPGETLCQVAKPDSTIDHYPQACAGCGKSLTAATATGHVARQVFDLPEPRPLIVTEHRAHACRCAACGTQTRAAFPEGMTAPVQYGTRIGSVRAVSAALPVAPRKAPGRADGRFCSEVKLVTATIARISRDCAQRFQGFAEALARACGSGTGQAGHGRDRLSDRRQDAVAAHRLGLPG